jgi:hypothetical protein
MADHYWTEDDDTVAFYLSRCQGTRFLGIGEGTIARILSSKPPPASHPAAPMPEGSLRMRVRNFDYLDGKPNGLPNYAPNKSGMVYEKYKDLSILELRPLVINILGITVRDAVDLTDPENLDEASCPRANQLKSNSGLESWSMG